MMNFSININAEISKIKSLLINSTEKIDFVDNYIERNFSKNKTRKFVSKIDGMNFKLMFIHRYSLFHSPLLKGNIIQSDNNINSINLSFSFNILFIVYILGLFIISTFGILDLINSAKDSAYIFILSIFIFFLFFELYKIKVKINELKSFLYRIYSEYIVEN